VDNPHERFLSTPIQFPLIVHELGKYLGTLVKAEMEY